MSYVISYVGAKSNADLLEARVIADAAEAAKIAKAAAVKTGKLAKDAAAVAKRSALKTAADAKKVAKDFDPMELG